MIETILVPYIICAVVYGAASVVDWWESVVSLSLHQEATEETVVEIGTGRDACAYNSGYSFSVKQQEDERRDPRAVPGGNLTDPY